MGSILADNSYFKDKQSGGNCAHLQPSRGKVFWNGLIVSVLIFESPRGLSSGATPRGCRNPNYQ
jgi:hypothetical protein